MAMMDNVCTQHQYLHMQQWKALFKIPLGLIPKGEYWARGGGGRQGFAIFLGSKAKVVDMAVPRSTAHIQSPGAFQAPGKYTKGRRI